MAGWASVGGRHQQRLPALAMLSPPSVMKRGGGRRLRRRHQEAMANRWLARASLHGICLAGSPGSYCTMEAFGQHTSGMAIVARSCHEACCKPTVQWPGTTI
jgi:hypothetical protein